MKREEFITGLRDAADFLEAHPALETPFGRLAVNVFVDTKEELAEYARTAAWKKGGNDSYFWLKRDIGSLSYEVNINREQVCRRIVVGTDTIPAQTVEKIEWACDEPLMATGMDDGVRR